MGKIVFLIIGFILSSIILPFFEPSITKKIQILQENEYDLDYQAISDFEKAWQDYVKKEDYWTKDRESVIGM